jgi:hypothetical protein
MWGNRYEVATVFTSATAMSAGQTGGGALGHGFGAVKRAKRHVHWGRCGEPLRSRHGFGVRKRHVRGSDLAVGWDTA